MASPAQKGARKFSFPISRKIAEYPDSWISVSSSNHYYVLPVCPSAIWFTLLSTYELHSALSQDHNPEVPFIHGIKLEAQDRWMMHWRLHTRSWGYGHHLWVELRGRRLLLIRLVGWSSCSVALHNPWLQPLGDSCFSNILFDHVGSRDWMVPPLVLWAAFSALFFFFFAIDVWNPKSFRFHDLGLVCFGNPVLFIAQVFYFNPITKMC